MKALSRATEEAEVPRARLLTTPFVEAFKRDLLNPWPNQNDSDIYGKEFGIFIEVLVQTHRKKSAPPVSGDAFRDRFAQFLTAQQWPTAHQLPVEWQTEDREACAAAEISLISRALLDAYWKFGNGGSPGTIPPHGP